MKIGPLRETIMFAHEADAGSGPWWCAFFLHEKGAKFASGGITVIKLRVRECRDDENAEYYAWWEVANSEFCFVFRRKFMVSMCFEYGADVEEKRGRGKIVRVIVEKVDEET